jgi:hypothetical protein
MCQEFLAIIKIDGDEVRIYDVNCKNQHKGKLDNKKTNNESV